MNQYIESADIVSSDAWAEANRQYLLAWLAHVRGALARHAGRINDEEVDERAADVPSWPFDDSIRPPALETLCKTFRLDEFERRVLLLCAGIELDGDFAQLVATIQKENQPAEPTFNLALSTLPHAHWAAITPAAPLRSWRLLELGPGNSLIGSPLRIDERILHYLVGVDQVDDRIACLTRSATQPAKQLAPDGTLPAQIANTWVQASGWQDLPLIQLLSPKVGASLPLADAAAEAVGLSGITISAAALPESHVDLTEFVRLWQRESMLSPVALLIEADDGVFDDAALRKRLDQVISQVKGPLMLCGLERRFPCRRASVAFDVPPPCRQHQLQLWHAAMDEDLGPVLRPALPDVVAQFDLDGESIRSVSARVIGQLMAELESGVELAADQPIRSLWEACRVQARIEINGLAERIECRADWEDLVVPDSVRNVLSEILIHVRRRAQVYEDWGFADKSRRGLGISALFAGPSGTGKTMAAEVLSRQLGLDLYRIDLSSVVSKYIGETEKNLRRVFDAAEGGSAILLFDEADALFGKRSEVKDSHDRHANVEISYLLQRMEAYGGLAILTTNLKDALDQAFMRRIRFVADFPFSGPAQRAEIWRRAFPPRTPIDGLVWERLAQFNGTGGSIRNLAMSAAMLAADQGQPVRMEHLLKAARSECAKTGRMISPSEIAGWDTAMCEDHADPNQDIKGVSA